MATPDDAKLDELKRLLRRLDKALPPPNGAPDRLPSSTKDSMSPRGRASRRASDGTALRTIALAGSVSMIVSLSVAALLLHGPAPLQRILTTVLAPSTIEVRSPPVPGDDPPQREGPPSPPVTETAALRLVDESPAAAPRDEASTKAVPGPAAATGQQGAAAPSQVAAVQGVETASPGAPEVESAATSPEMRHAARDSASSGAPQSSHALTELDASQFLRRGLNMLSSGNIEAGQLLLERAADLGSGDAAFTLASTYDGDPGAPRHGLAVRPNARLAVRWYERAQALGVAAAQKRLGELKATGRAQAGKVE